MRAGCGRMRMVTALLSLQDQDIAVWRFTLRPPHPWEIYGPRIAHGNERAYREIRPLGFPVPVRRLMNTHLGGCIYESVYFQPPQHKQRDRIPLPPAVRSSTCFSRVLNQ